MTEHAIPEIPFNTEIPLPPRGSWPASVHQFEEQHAWAIRAALAAQRPLLVRGEPGTGKSQMARAAAEVLRRVFISEVVHTRSESQDLQWRYDAVARLGEAQALAASGLSKDEVQNRLDPKHFLSPGPLWWVFDWTSAVDQHQEARGTHPAPEVPEDWTPAQGAVLLIDEIDKADADLPNGLLETLGNGAFQVPWLSSPIGAKIETPPPLVIITTNEERELPAAFVRRCLVLHLDLPKERSEFIDKLIARGRLHFKDRCSETVYRKAADQLWDDRQIAEANGVPLPGQAEYIDMLRAVSTLEKKLDRQERLLNKISDFALKKHSLHES